MKFTCLLPVHAGDDPPAFDAALASIGANSRRPDRLIICQDGPLHGPLAERVAASGASVVRNPGPRGLHHNLNHAVAAVATAWICRADADDINRPDRFERQLLHLAANPRLAALGGAIDEITPDARRRLKTMPLDHPAIARRARWRNPINHMTAFIRLEAVRDCGGWPAIERKEDYGLWLTMIARGWRLANLPEVLVDARLGADFTGRRGGLHNLASEYALYGLRRGLPGFDPFSAALSHLARAGALSSRAVAGLAYRHVMRR